MEEIDDLIARGSADPDKLGIGGWNGKEAVGRRMVLRFAL
jgi:hypothetical protein